MKEILKNKKVLIPIATIILAVIILGVSYAYYVANVTENNKTESVIQTKELKIAFDGTQEIEANSITPGWSAEKKFTVENLTNSKTSFNIYMQNITNEFDNELTYSLYETDSTGTIINTLVEDEILPQTNADKSYLQSDIELNPQPTKKYYTIKIEFENKATSQNEYQGAHFRATVGVDAAARKDVAVISGERIDASSITEGSSVTKSFELLNYSTETQRYDLKLSDVVNTYASGLKYSLKKNGVEVIASTAMPTTDTTLLTNQTIASAAKDTYEMTITYDTTQANADGFRLLANEVNTFTANIDTKVLELEKELGEKVNLSLVKRNTESKTFSVTNYTSSTKTFSINLSEIADNYIDGLTYILKKNNEIVTNGNITSLNMNILSNASIAGSTTDTYIIEIDNPSKKLVPGSAAAVVANSGDVVDDGTSDSVLRYTGSNPNNYVTFNGETAGWRIIGVYDDKIKIIKTSLLGNRKYGSGVSPWNMPCDLNKYLNSTYYDGLTDEAKDMIADDGVWYLGVSEFTNNATTTYSNAIKTPWSGSKVGLIASYEYLYASDSSCWSVSGGGNFKSCGKSKGWLTSSSHYWTLTSKVAGSSYIIVVMTDGYLNQTTTGYSYGVRPVVYLKSDTRITGGTGTQLEPYILE